MKPTRYLLIGGGLACNEAAKQLRKADADSAITMVSDEPHLPYNRPPLSKEFLMGQKPKEKLFLSPETFYSDNNIDTVLNVAVQKINVQDKRAILSNGAELSFEKALIATGGRPVQLNVPGSDLQGVHYLRTLDDSIALAEEATKGKKAVILGAGFIGMEMAASLTLMGVDVTVVHSRPYIWSRFLEESLAEFFQDYCSAKGITFITRDTIAEIKGKDQVSSVVLKSGREVACDFICVCIGIRPNVELAKSAGLQVDNGVVVNEYLQTSHPDLFAAGDMTNYPDPLFGKRRRVEHWGLAYYCGQLAGKNMIEPVNQFDHLSFAWSNIFDLSLQFVGDESEHDEVLVRGSFAEESFIVFYIKKKIITAYFAVNTPPQQFSALKNLIKSKTNVSGKEAQLQDPDFDVTTLAE